MATVPRRDAAQQQRERLQTRRLHAAELFAIGMRQAEVARQLGVSRQAVSGWHARWQTGGADALRAEGRPDPHHACRTASSLGSNRSCSRAPRPTGLLVSCGRWTASPP
jgi:transposase-like protein